MNAFNDEWAEAAAASYRARHQAGIAINPNPLMTQFLIKETDTFKADPFIIIDVGARGGLAPHWDVLNPCMRAFCFEPDEAECERLQKIAPDYVTYIPRALADKPGTRTLYETALPDSSGLYKTNMDYFGRFVNAPNGVTLSEREIEVMTLDIAMKAFGIPKPDFLKLDAEGGELDILRGALDASPLGIISEIRFHQEINGSASFAASDLAMRAYGLRLYDLTFHRHSRKDLPYPQKVKALKQDGSQFFGVTTRGQIQDGDALYFRDLLLNKASLDAMPPVQVLKLACLMELYSLNDCAAELVLSGAILTGIEVRKLLDLLAAGIE